MHISIINYLQLVLLMTLPVCIVGLVNLFAFQKPRAIVQPEEQLPFISILVPARDEEKVIERCVQSLLAQNYPQFEVIVLDDNSSDETYEILCRMRDRDHRLKVLVGALLPDGWCGKPHACWQLANAASNSLLLFTDADCIFAPDALLFAVGAMTEHKADVISLSPDYIALSFWEQLLVQQLIFIPLFFAPMPLVNGNKFSVIGGANGSFLLMSKTTYFDVDGHKAVRAELAEDVKFAQHIKRCGKSLWYGDGLHVYSVRMYESLAQIWAGFTRNLFPAFSGKLIYLVPTLVYILVVFVAPLPIALYGFAIGAPWVALALSPYLLIVFLRLAILTTLKRGSFWFTLLNPLAWTATIITAVGSVIKTLSSGAEWKGRTYVKGQIQHID